MSQPAISKHLKVLENAGLVARGRDAQRRPCRPRGHALAEATDLAREIPAVLGDPFSDKSIRCSKNCQTTGEKDGAASSPANRIPIKETLS